MKTILVVDDDAGVRESLVVVLRENFDIMTAANGRDALKCMETVIFDAIVLDVTMPFVDGEGVLAAMRRRNIGTPVVLASALPDLRARAARLGVAYIEKPYDFDKFEALLKRLTAPHAAPS